MVSSQPVSKSAVKFCDQVGQGKAATINIDREDLKKCDFSIFASDSNFTIINFSLTYFDGNNKSKLREEKIVGNTIPKKFRKEILSGKGKLLIEYVRAKAPDGTTRSLQGTTVNIN